MFESCLKCFSARVQIPLKHVRGIEWLICIKKKKGSRMEGWKEVKKGENEGRVSELVRPKSLEAHVTTHKEEGTQSLKFSPVLSDPNCHIFVSSLYLSFFALKISTVSHEHKQKQCSNNHFYTFGPFYPFYMLPFSQISVIFVYCISTLTSSR